MLKELFRRFVLLRYILIALSICLALLLTFTVINIQDLFDDGIVVIVIGFVLVIALVFVCGAGLCGAILAGALLIGIIRTSLKQFKSYRSTKDDAQMRALEQQRLKVQAANLIFWLLFFSLFFIHWSLPFVFLCLGYITVIYPLNKAYKRKFKDMVVTPILAATFTNWKFEPDKTFSAEEVKASNLFYRFNRLSGNDYLEAAYGHITFKQSDITFRYADGGRAYKKNKRDEICICRLMQFDFPLNFPLEVQVYDKKFKAASHQENDIKTELDSFNQRFNIVAPDALSAMRVLTPQVIEGLAKISSEIITPLAFSFQGNKLYAALAKDEDPFEATTFGDITLLEEQEKVKQEFALICAFLGNIYLKPTAADL